jgi:hypothetical protein
MGYLYHPKLDGFIFTRDKRAAKSAGYAKAPHSENFARLVAGQQVVVGGRATCGSKLDPTWAEFTAWKEIVHKARSLGFVIEETPVKHGNAWATKAGGFWDENQYRLVTTPQIALLSAFIPIKTEAAQAV